MAEYTAISLNYLESLVSSLNVIGDPVSPGRLVVKKGTYTSETIPEVSFVPDGLNNSFKSLSDSSLIILNGNYTAYDVSNEIFILNPVLDFRTIDGVQLIIFPDSFEFEPVLMDLQMKPSEIVGSRAIVFNGQVQPNFKTKLESTAAVTINGIKRLTPTFVPFGAEPDKEIVVDTDIAIM